MNSSGFSDLSRKYHKDSVALRRPRGLKRASFRTLRPKVAGGDNNQDAYLAYQQILGTLKVTYDITVSGAGGYLFYPGHGGTGAAAATTTVAGVTTISTRPLSPTPGTTGAGRGAGNSIGQNGNVLSNRAPFNSANSSRNLSIGTFHGDVKLGLGKLKLKVYGQAAYNLQGGQRDSQEYGERLLHDDTVDKLGFATGLTIARITRSRRAVSCCGRSTGRSVSVPWTRI